MFTTCRVYTNAKELASTIISNRSEVEKLLRAVPGFQAYYLIQTEDGFTSVTVCDDKKGADESNQAAAKFIREKAMGLTGTTPKIYAGPTPISFSAGKAAITV